jgi:ubiquinone/menaquinone biosynthesis C-methylase UbiE
MSNSQKDAFLKYEADSWFARNKNHGYSADNDIVIQVLKEYNAAPTSALEIGCSFGYRLNAIQKEFQNTRVSGIEPSERAIEEGKSHYPSINIIRGTADDMSSFDSGMFDLVIIGFVLYVVDREMLFRVVSETDRVLKDGGILMIIDFFSEKPVRNPYEHIRDIQAFAFKQNYEDIFTASKLYHLLDKRSMSHSTKGYDLTADFYNKYSLTTLRKDLSAGYK